MGRLSRVLLVFYSLFSIYCYVGFLNQNYAHASECSDGLVPLQKITREAVLDLLKIDYSADRLRAGKLYLGIYFIEVSENKNVQMLFGSSSVNRVWACLEVDGSIDSKKFAVTLKRFILFNGHETYEYSLYSEGDFTSFRTPKIEEILGVSVKSILGINDNSFKLINEVKSIKSPMTVAALVENKIPDLEMLRTDVVYSMPRTSYGSIYGATLLGSALKKIKSLGKQKKPLRVLVLGSGIGYEAVVLAKATNARIDAIDISEDAVHIGVLNAKLYRVSDRVRFWKSDLFNEVTDKYDLIIFNAPRPIYYKDYLEFFTSLPRPDPEAIIRRDFESLATRSTLFDLDGVLLNRLLNEVTQHFKSSKSSLLLMTEAIFPEKLPESLKVIKVSDEHLWSRFSTDDTRKFAIQEISLKKQ